MRRRIAIGILVFLGIAVLVLRSLSAVEYPASLEYRPWKNIYGIQITSNTPKEIARYCKSMGFWAMCWSESDSIDTSDPVYQGLRFIIGSPMVRTYARVEGGVEYSNTLTKSGGTNGKAFNEKYMAMEDPGIDADGDGSTFPNNVITGWITSYNDSTPPYIENFLTRWDFQQKRARDKVVEGTVEYALKNQNLSNAFLFEGTHDDEWRIYGPFCKYSGTVTSRNAYDDTRRWTNTWSSYIVGDAVHDKDTFDDGQEQFYLDLLERCRAIWPHFKWGVSPGLIYNAGWSYPDKVWSPEFIKQTQDRTNWAALRPDLLYQENNGLYLYTNSGHYSGNYQFKSDDLGWSSPARNKTISAQMDEICRAAGNLFYIAWYNRIDETSNAKIQNMEKWIRVGRVIPTWDNLNLIPLADRSNPTLGGNLGYISMVDDQPWSYADRDQFYTRPDQNRMPNTIYACFRTTSTPPSGSITIHTDEKVAHIWSTNDFLEKDQIVTSDFNIAGNIITPGPGITGSSNGLAYIIDVYKDTNTIRTLVHKPFETSQRTTVTGVGATVTIE